MTQGTCIPPRWNTEHTKDAGIDPMHSLAHRTFYATFDCVHKAGIGTQAMAFSLGVRTWDSGPEEKDAVALKKCLPGTLASSFCPMVAVVCHHRTHIQETSPGTEHYGPRRWKRPERRAQTVAVPVMGVIVRTVSYQIQTFKRLILGPCLSHWASAV